MLRRDAPSLSPCVGRSFMQIRPAPLSFRPKIAPRGHESFIIASWRRHIDPASWQPIGDRLGCVWERRGGSTMTVQLACSIPEPVTYDFRRPKCPRCGSVLLIAEIRVQSQRSHPARLGVRRLRARVCDLDPFVAALAHFWALGRVASVGSASVSYPARVLHQSSSVALRSRGARRTRAE